VTVTRTGVVEVALPPDQALELFTARGESLWVPGWSPTYIEPTSGEPVAGGIWLTDDRNADGSSTQVIWRVQRFDRVALCAEYLRVVPGDRVVVVRIECAPWLKGGAVHTRATVSYTVTPISPVGERWLAAFDDAAYSKMMDEWTRLLAAYLERRR
jgi:hypothetical protein